MWKSCTLTVLAALTLGRLQAAAADDQIQYSRDVRPILAEHCFQCHGPDDEKRESGLRLDTRDGALALADSGRAAIKAGDQEIEEDLALRRQKRAGPKLVCRQCPEIGGDQILQKMLCIRPRDQDKGAIGQEG